MTVALDEIVHVEGVAVAALARTSVHSTARPFIGVYGSKHPVAILVRRDAVTMAFDIDGTPIAASDFERRFPGRLAEFEARLDG